MKGTTWVMLGIGALLVGLVVFGTMKAKNPATLTQQRPNLNTGPTMHGTLSIPKQVSAKVKLPRLQQVDYQLTPDPKHPGSFIQSPEVNV